MLRFVLPLLAITLSLPAVAHAQEPAPFSCAVGDAGPLSEIEARTVADLTCAELAKAHAPPSKYTMNIGQLGSRLRVVLSNGREERDAWVGSADEIPTALPRVSQALVSQSSVASTESVDNVLEPDTLAPRTKNGQLHAVVGMFGATSLGSNSSGLSGGFDVALMYRARRYDFFAEARLGGIGSADSKVSGGGVGIGSHFYFSQSDFSPLIGGGFEVSSYSIRSSGSGIGAFGEIGVAGFRTNKVGLMATARVAAPFYDIGSSYTLPVTMNLSMSFL